MNFYRHVSIVLKNVKKDDVLLHTLAILSAFATEDENRFVNPSAMIPLEYRVSCLYPWNLNSKMF